MAEGIRITPQPGRLLESANRLIILRDRARPIALTPNSPVCHICGTPHDCKTYHFQLDSDGTIIVSATIWENLQSMYDHGGFEKVNVVPEPPDQTILLPGS